MVAHNAETREGWTMEFDRVETPADAVFQALGAASMCWQYPEKAGIFQSDRAKVIGEALLEKLTELAAQSDGQEGP